MHKIDWLNQPGYRGETINPIRARRWGNDKDGTHCEKAGSGCANCYAERHNGRCLPTGGTGLPYTRESRDRVEIYLDEDKLAKVGRWKKPRCIFWCSLTDMFGEWVPTDMTKACLDVMAETPRHRHIVLTKRPERMAEWSLGRAWALASASDQKALADAERCFVDFEARIVGLSLEPLLGPVEITRGYLRFLSWVIVGCESGPRRRPCKLEWVRSIVKQCREAGVRCYVKQVSMFRYMGARSSDWYVSRDPSRWPEDLRVQEFPEP